MKLFKLLFSLLFLLTASINISSAAGTIETCPGVPKNLIWTSTGATSCSGTNSGYPGCQFGASTGGSLSIPSPQSSCTVNYSCSNSGGTTPDSATLNVVNKASCCGTGSQTNQPNAYTDPSSGFRCNCPEGTYNNGANTCTTLLAPTVTAVYSGLDHPLVTPTCPTPLIIATLIRTTGPNPILIDNTGSGADPSSDGRGGGSPVRE